MFARAGIGDNCNLEVEINDSRIWWRNVHFNYTNFRASRRYIPYDRQYLIR
jgi:hypothetical protein